MDEERKIDCKCVDKDVIIKELLSCYELLHEAIPLAARLITLGGVKQNDQYLFWRAVVKCHWLTDFASEEEDEEDNGSWEEGIIQHRIDVLCLELRDLTTAKTTAQDTRDKPKSA